MMRKWPLGIVAVLAGVIAAALAYAPYLPRLATEGIPPLVGVGHGSFAGIAGVATPNDLGVGATSLQSRFSDELGTLFAASQGAALLVARAGQLELEHYGPGVDVDSPINSYSMAKSLIGALIYKALAEGKIASLDTTLAELLPDDLGLRGVSLRALLTMRADINFDTGSSFGAGSGGKDIDTSPNPFGPLARLHFLGLPAIEAGLTVETPASGRFNYQNVNTALLGEVLERVYQRPLQDLLAEKIWLRAQARPALWRQPNAGQPVSAYCCIYATARDWIRIGVYLASNGTVDAPFLPEPLWREFLGLDVDAAERQSDHYGQHVRQNVLDRAGQSLQGPFSYFLGQDGQLLYLMPERGLVVYRAGYGMPLLHSTLYAAWNALGPQGAD